MKLFKFSMTVSANEHKKIIKARGSRNAVDFQRGSDIHAAGSLVLRGFEGTRNNDTKRIEGHLVCRPAQPADDEREIIDFYELSGNDMDELKTKVK